MGAEFHTEPAPHPEEELILVGMVVPHELSLELGQLDVLSVECAHDRGAPMLADLGELLGQDYLLHFVSSGRGRVCTICWSFPCYLCNPAGWDA